jgi:hypothetical protein
MGVQRKVTRIQGDIGLNEDSEAFPKRTYDGLGLSPKHPMVGNQKVASGGGRCPDSRKVGVNNRRDSVDAA